MTPTSPQPPLSDVLRASFLQRFPADVAGPLAKAAELVHDALLEGAPFEAPARGRTGLLARELAALLTDLRYLADQLRDARPRGSGLSEADRALSQAARSARRRVLAAARFLDSALATLGNGPR